MTALAIDSATELLSVALIHEKGKRYFELDDGLRHSERLMETIDALFVSARIEAKDMDLVACMAGPGSFTGLRIAYGVAKGMATALGIPLVTIPTLDCWAQGQAQWPGLVIPLLDAKKGQYFAGLYRKGILHGSYLDVSPQDLADLLMGDEPILLTGIDAPQAYKSLCLHIPSHKLYVDAAYRSGKARELLDLALEKYRREGHGESDESGPLYLRKSDAELVKELRDAETYGKS